MIKEMFDKCSCQNCESFQPEHFSGHQIYMCMNEESVGYQTVSKILCSLYKANPDFKGVEVMEDLKCKNCKNSELHGDITFVYVCKITKLITHSKMANENIKENFDCEHHISSIEERLHELEAEARNLKLKVLDLKNFRREYYG